MREKAENRKNIYYADISNLTNQEYLTRMKFTEDGRHPDNFPNESKVTEGIVF